MVHDRDGAAMTSLELKGALHDYLRGARETLVWKLDGQEAGRQTLDVGRAPAWRTWGSWPTKKSHVIEVEVVNKDGASLHKDSVTLAVPAAAGGAT